MSSELQLKIVSLKEVVYNDYADSVTLPTKAGEITVLPHHVGLVSQLTEGNIFARFEGKEKSFPVSGGFLEVSPDSRMTILLN